MSPNLLQCCQQVFIRMNISMNGKDQRLSMWWHLSKCRSLKQIHESLLKILRPIICYVLTCKQYISMNKNCQWMVLGGFKNNSDLMKLSEKNIILNILSSYINYTMIYHFYQKERKLLNMKNLCLVWKIKNEYAVHTRKSK